ncbi:MAG: hypothetical protein ACFB0A_13360 [Croceivirga sp.]
MKVFVPLLSVALFFIALISCDDRDDNLTGPNIRIHNLSSQNFTMVEVPQDTIRYENIGSEGFSPYQEYNEAFEQMALIVSADSSTFNFSPSELNFEPLPIGLYTYQLNIDEEGQLIFNFKVD